MKNIWIINHYAMPPEYEVRVRNNVMAKYLQEWGYKVKIFAASTIHNTNINLIKDKKNLFIEKSYDGLDFVHIRASNYTGNGIARIINMIEFPLHLYRVSKKIDSHPDVIVCDLTTIFAVIPYWIAKRYNSKFIIEVRDLWPESIVEYMKLSRKNPIIWILYKFEKWIYKKADKLIFTMEGGRDYIIEKGWNKENGGPIDLNKVHHINNGVDLEAFDYNRDNYIFEDEDLSDRQNFKVIYAGSIRLANNVKSIIDAAQVINKKNLNCIRFLIYGDGSDREYLEKYCLDNRITNVKFKGFIDKKRIPFILSRSDLNIMHVEKSKITKYGISLNKMFEYFASGKPTLSDCECGYDLITKYQCGIVIDGANAEQLSDAIEKFYKMSKDEYSKYCQNARSAANDYDFKILTKKLIEIIEGLQLK